VDTDVAVLPLPATTGTRSRLLPTGIALPSLHSLRSRLVQLAKRAWDPRYRSLTLPLLGLTVASTVGIVASPWLIRWPLLLAMLTPRMPFLALAARTTSAPVFLAAGLVRLCIGDPFQYLLGRRLSADGQRRSARRWMPPWLGRQLDRWARVQTSACVVSIVLRPVGRHLFAAGALRARPLAVATADVLSTAALLIALHRGASLF
jgi:hypothetical protein